MNKAPLTSFKSWPSFLLIGRLLSDIDHPPYFLHRITCDPLLNLPEGVIIFNIKIYSVVNNNETQSRNSRAVGPV